MENRSHALWAGFFTLTMFCAAVFAGIWLNRDKTVRTEYQIATTRAVSGLNPQAAVRYKGLAVGRVDKIDFDDTVAGQILIDISIDPDTPITQSTFATLGYQGVTGIAFVQLDDDGSKPVKVNIVAGQVPRIPLRPGLFERIEASSTKILENAEVVTERLSQLLTPENQKTMLGAFSSTTQTTERWTKLADELGPTAQMLPGMVQQTGQTLKSVQELSNNASQLSQQLTGLTRQLQDPNGALNHSLATVGNLSDNIQSDTLPKISTLSTDASNSMRNFDQAIEELKEHPQNLLFGKPASVPGPGEAGFVEPKK
jgi:phospholipid/cholesterol/gamma-HCH transport system substrate-binding protein